MDETVFARTPRLVWRAGTPNDLQALHAIVSGFDVVRQTETWPWPANLSCTRSRCVVTASDQAASGVVCQGDEVVGYLGLSPEVKIGYMFGKSHWGRGLATEIGVAAVAYAFDKFGWESLEACVFADNPASGRVLEKLGFQEGKACQGPCRARGGVHPIRTFRRPRA
ncbi:GNAT family N-acetyltransferase [Roseovarius confluentis]|uniref:GNAT family N-acetyltransferase n=1 Tax=Roseovarius confluentis TaxID=1852027 RepID=UPI0014735223|nr:GNAT family N-acetyltransferase [Roseovarius confluentis]